MNTLSLVRGTDARSRNSERPAGVADTLQVSNAIVECHADDPSNILSNDPSGPELLHNAEHFRPEETVVLCASPLPGDGKRLAGEPAGDEGRAFDAGVPESVSCNGSHVVESRHARPVFREDLLAERVLLDLGDGAEPGPLCGEVDPSDACEEGEVSEITHTPPPAVRAYWAVVTRGTCAIVLSSARDCIGRRGDAITRSPPRPSTRATGIVRATPDRETTECRGPPHASHGGIGNAREIDPCNYKSRARLLPIPRPHEGEDRPRVLRMRGIPDVEGGG